MHAEHFYFSRHSLESLLLHQGKIMAVGTTSTRILESIYWLGIRLKEEYPPDESSFFIDQWDAYKLPMICRKTSLKNLFSPQIYNFSKNDLHNQLLLFDF